jgi:hypothetical protein
MKQENETMNLRNSNWPANRMRHTVKKCLLIALALASVTTASAAPAFAAGDQDQDTVHAKRLHMYAPGALNQNRTKSARDASSRSAATSPQN